MNHGDWAIFEMEQHDYEYRIFIKHSPWVCPIKFLRPIINYKKDSHL